MVDLSAYAKRPLALFVHYVLLRPYAHALILAAIVLAVACSVSTQYAVKFLVDTLSLPQKSIDAAWRAFALLTALIAADNLLWRLASWVANSAFVGTTGDVRRDLFRYVTGHAPSYFTSRTPGTLTSRITATSNALFTTENMLVWNVLPPCLATAFAIGFVAGVSLAMAAGLLVVAGIIVVSMFWAAASGKPLHYRYADRAAAVDGEMTDIVGNMSLVKAFGGLQREHKRFDAQIEDEMAARRASLFYLERVRIAHALVTASLALALLAWAVTLWQRGEATPGDVVLVCTLGLAVLHATRDLAVALVDVTQHMARFSEALGALLVPHQLRDQPGAAPLAQAGTDVTFEDITFAYPDCPLVFKNLSLHVPTGQRMGLLGRSGGGKSTLFALLQRFYDLRSGRILIDSQDITQVTQQSLREVIAVVPQDVTLFHRSLLENIRYGRPEASDSEVWEAAVAAHCSSFIEEFPDGLNTLVGDRGVRLSGGQRQRIAIARAFLKDAPLLLLDEATSALDIESEELIREALGRLMHGRTVIAIAHRLSTLRSFDRIVVLQQGRVVQDGAPEHLMRCEGAYRELVKSEMCRLRHVYPQAA